MKVIGMIGEMQSGKDTFYEYARQKLVRTYRLSVADEVCREVAAATGYRVEFINEHKERFRPVLQWWGTEFRRELCHQNYWVDRLKLRASMLPKDSIVFLTSTRFLTEEALIRSMGGIVIRMERVYPWRQRFQRLFKVPARLRHISEQEQLKIKADYTIRASSVGELHLKADQLLNHLRPWLLHSE